MSTLRRIAAIEALLDLIYAQPKEEMEQHTAAYAKGHAEHGTDNEETLAKVEAMLAEIITTIAEGK